MYSNDILVLFFDRSYKSVYHELSFCHAKNIVLKFISLIPNFNKFTTVYP